MDPSDIPVLLHDAFETQRAAHAKTPFPEWSVRRNRLERLRRLVETHEKEIARAIDADFGGRPGIETAFAEVFPSVSEVKAALRHGKSWMQPRAAAVSKWFLPARAQIVPRPVGVVGVIVPWNYPLFLAVGPLAAILAAGNRALVKMSEFTPSFSELFQQLVRNDFEAEELCVVTGGPDVAAAFSALPFDHLMFTGSTAVGRKVMQSAAANLTPVTLELGGKSPTVIAPGFSVERAVERIMTGKLLNAGQTCIAPDYVLVPRPAMTAFIEASRSTVRRMYPSGLEDRDYASIVNRRQYDRLIGLIADAESNGAKVVPLFERESRVDEAHRLGPSLVIEPTQRTAIMREEIFGPLLPVIPYDDIDEALANINAHPHPLALYWFDDDAKRIEHAIKSTHVGGVCINDTLLHISQESLPFGGVGPSGMGHYHGQWGFDTFSKLTPVFRQARFNGMKLLMPPYQPRVRKLLALMNRF